MYDDRSTHIEIDNEGGGDFIKVVQSHVSSSVRAATGTASGISGGFLFPLIIKKRN